MRTRLWGADLDMMNHTDIDWGYLVGLLTMMEAEQPLSPIQEWLDRHQDARFYVVQSQQLDEFLEMAAQAELREMTDEDWQGMEDNYKRLHRHTNFLLDMEFIEQHENKMPYDHMLWFQNYEVWPRRITAKGYLFLEMIREAEESAHESTGESLMQRLQRVATLVGTEAIKHGVGESFKLLGGNI